MPSLKKVYRLTSFLAALLGAVLICIYLSRGPLAALLVRTYLLPELKSRGVNLTFKQLDTDLFSSVTLSGLSLTAEIPEAAKVSGVVSHVTLHYNLAALWRDPSGALAASSLLIDGAELRYTVDERSKAAPQKENLFAITLPELPSGIPSVSFRNCAATVKARDWRIELDGLSGFGKPVTTEGRKGLIGSLDLVAVRQQGLPFYRQRRQVKVDFAYRSGRLRFPALSVGGKKVMQDAKISFSAAGLRAAGTLALTGGMVDFQLDGKDTMLQGSVHSRELQATEVGAFLEHPAAVHGILALQCSFHFDVRHPESGSARLRLNLEKGRVAQYPIDRLFAQLRLANGIVSGRKVSMLSAANQAVFTGIKIKLDDLLRRDYWKTVREGAAEVKLSLGDWRKIADLLPGPLAKGLSNIRCRELHLDGLLRDASLKVAAFSLQGPQVDVNIKKGAISLPKDIKNWQSTRVAADFSFVLDKFSLLHPYLPVVLREMQGRVQGRGRLAGTLASPAGSLSCRAAGVKYLSLPLFAVQAEAKLEKDSVQLSKMTVVSGRDRIEGHGRLPFSSAKSFSLTAEGQVGQVSAYAGLFLPESEVAGDLSVSLTAHGTYAAPQGSADLHSSRLAIAGQRFQKATASLTYKAKRLTIVASHFSKEDAEFRLAGSIASGEGDWQTMAGELDSLHVFWHGHVFRLAGLTRFAYASQTFSLVKPARFDSDFGALILTGSAGQKRLALKLKADALQLPAGMQLAPGKELTFAKASLELALNGSPAAPSIIGQARLHRLRGAGFAAAFEGETSFRYDERGLVLDTFELDGGAGGHISLAGHLPAVWRQGSLQPLSAPLILRAGINLPDGAFLQQLFPSVIGKAGPLNGEIRLHGTLDKPLGKVVVKVQGLQPAVGSDWLPPGSLSADLRLQAEENRLQVEAFRIVGPSLEVKIKGHIDGNVSLADLLRHDKSKFAAGLALHGTLNLPNLAWLAERFSAIRRVDGGLAGDFTLQGPLQHPSLRGDFQISNGELRSSEELPALRDLSGEILVDGSSITFPGLTGLLGGAPATAKGRILIAGPGGPTFDLQLAGKNLLIYRADGVKMRADAALVLKGTYKAPVVEGKLVLTDGYYNKNIRLLKMISSQVTQSGAALQGRFSLFSFSDEPLKDAKFSIAIRSEAPFTVNTNLLKGNLRPDLQLTGTGELPQLIGEIYVDNARCSLPAGPLLIDSGLLRFRQADPDRFYLELSGSAKMMGYDITAKINGPYDEPTIDLSSYPPLGNEELLLLLLTGQRPANSNGTGPGGAEMSRVAVYLGRELLRSLFGKENIDEQSIMERLQINIGREITRQGDDTIEAKFLLKDGIFKKNDSLYLTAEKDVWDDYNGGLRLIFRFP